MRFASVAIALAAALQGSIGRAIAGQNRIDPVSTMIARRLAPPATRRASSTHSPYVSAYSYASGPGWSCAKVKRMATKRRNIARNKRARRAS